MMPSRLHREFEYVRQVFFSRWDREGKWRIGKAADLDGACGKCRSNDKTIMIDRGYLDEGKDTLRLVLIHEISHAVTRGGHGNPWQTRMEEAAKRAGRVGQQALAGLLRKEVQEYQKTGSSPESVGRFRGVAA